MLGPGRLCYYGPGETLCFGEAVREETVTCEPCARCEGVGSSVKCAAAKLLIAVPHSRPIERDCCRGQSPAGDARKSQRRDPPAGLHLRHVLCGRRDRQTEPEAGNNEIVIAEGTIAQGEQIAGWKEGDEEPADAESGHRYGSAQRHASPGRGQERQPSCRPEPTSAP